MQLELFAVDHDGVTSIVTTLVASNDFCIADRKSVIFPFPSSPHWVPTTTTDVISLSELYSSSFLEKQAGISPAIMFYTSLYEKFDNFFKEGSSFHLFFLLCRRITFLQNMYFLNFST